ncbi:hypothetical protein ACFV80_43315 [Streptomyces sp. NPDC059862]|uniref:hypothetical protein n=1 Tax=Streptomyces sp. NPDC059862 TaxID=3346975 RepID=UPI003667ECCF
MSPQPATASEYAEDDLLELRRLMTELLSVCASVVAEHAPEGMWKPAASGPGLFDEAPVVIEALSRKLNRTRRDIHKLRTQNDQEARQTAAGTVITASPAAPGSPGWPEMRRQEPWFQLVSLTGLSHGPARFADVDAAEQ